MPYYAPSYRHGEHEPTNSSRAAGRRPARSLGVAISSFAVAAVAALGGCADVPTGLDLAASPVSRPVFPHSTGNGLSEAPDLVTIHVAAGTVQDVVVPRNVNFAQIVVKGASGDRDEGALGAAVSGELPVNAGDVLTIAAAGRGARADGDKAPGGGGWSLPGFEGGRGGSGHGSQTEDGGGGGGASAIKVNGETRVVAGGGGGAGGVLSKLASHKEGGSAGADAGDSLRAPGGQGGSAQNPSLDPTGKSATGSRPMGGGGGGGGGWHRGGGGGATVYGGESGGGGDSMYKTLRNVTVGVGEGNCKSFGGCTVFGNRGNGDVVLTWQITTLAGQDTTFGKTGGPATLALGSAVTGSQDAGAPLDVDERIADGADAVRQTWNYKVLDPSNSNSAGTLANRSTGLCMEVNSSTGRLDQGMCDKDRSNQLWRLVKQPSNQYVLAVDLDRPIASLFADTYYLAYGTASGGDGTHKPELDLVSDPANRDAAWTKTNV